MRASHLHLAAAGSFSKGVQESLRSRLSINTFVIMAIRLLGTVAGFVFWMLAARTARAEEVGLASGAVAAAALFARLAQLGLGQTVVRFLPEAAQPDRLVNSAICVVGAASCVLAVLFLAGTPFWAPTQAALSADGAAVVLFVALAASAALTGLLTWIFLAFRKPVYSLIKYTIQAVLSVLLLWLFTRTGAGHVELLAAYTMATVIGLGIALFALLPLARPGYHVSISLPRREDMQLSGFALSNFVADLLRTAPHNLIPLLAINILGPASGATLFVVWNIVIGLDSMAGAVSPSFFAEGANGPAQLQQFARRALALGCALGLACIIGAICLGEPLLRLFGESYAADGYAVMVWLVVAIIPSIIVSICLNILRIRSRVSMLVLISFADVALGLVMAGFGMMRFGLWGIGVGWLVSRLIILAATVVVVRTTRATAA